MLHALLRSAFQRSAAKLFHRIDIRNQIQHFVRITPLVIVPRNQLHEVARKRDTRRCIEDGRMSVAEDVAGNDSVFRIGHNAFQFAFAGFLDSRANLIIGRFFLKSASEVNNRAVKRRNTHRHTRQLAVQFRNNLADRFCSARGRRNDVAGSSTSASPVLLGRTVNRLLGRRCRMNRRHKAFNETKVIVDNFRQRSQAVRRAGCVGTLTINRTNIQFLVFFRHRYHNRSDNRCRIPDKNIILRNKSPEPILTLLLLNFRVWEIRY